MKLTSLILAGALASVLIPAGAYAASDTGGLKPMPAHGYMVSGKIEAFKDRREVAYENQTWQQDERDNKVQGNAYGDQTNIIPAKEKYYRNHRGCLDQDRHGALYDCTPASHRR